MSEFSQSPSNYTMLTENLYILFRCYILSGRTRAPPEIELRDLIPTFHPGAKTNRRALQSKFKSWARRMDIRNGKLVLTSTGKLIIPEEKCDELILALHFQDHQPVDQVIFQIRRNYTWTKKNFGMDRETVTSSIVKNCPNAECRKEMKKDFANRNYSKIFIPGPLLSPVPTRLVPSTAVINPVVLAPDWSMNFPTPRNISTTEYSIPPNFINKPSTSSLNVASAMQPTIIPRSWIQNMQKVSLDATKLPNVHVPLPLPERYLRSSENTNLSRDGSPSLKPCKKVRNIHEFEAALKASKCRPEIFPLVLTHPKTRFLSTLGLVPKRICTKSTLSRFSRELFKKQMAKKRLWCRVGGTVLRDRNKLSKTRPYTQEARRRSLELPKLPKRRLAIMQNARLVETSKFSRIGQASVLSSTSAPKPEPEVIDIASSSDEESKVTEPEKDKDDATKQKLKWLLSRRLNGSFQKPVSGATLRTYLIPTSTANAAIQLPSDFQCKGQDGLQKHSSSVTGQFPFKSNPETKNVGECEVKGPIKNVIRPIAIRPKLNVIRSNPIHRLEQNNYKVILVEKKLNGTFQIVDSYPLCQPKQFSSVKVKQPIAPRMKGPLGSPANSQLLTSSKQQLSNHDSIGNSEKEKAPIKRDISCEMKMLCNWISKMKSFITPTIFWRGTEKVSQRLTAQLNIGIHLVQDVRRAAYEVEKNHEKITEHEDEVANKQIESLEEIPK